MKNNTHKNRLKAYSALAGSIVLMGSQADAQIIYTDINPDSTTIIPGNFYNLDLDNDGTFDFSFNLNFGSTSSYTSQQVGVTPAGSNAIAGDTVGAYIYPFAFNSGDTVKSTLQFNVGSNQSMGSYFGAGYSYGNWLGVTDKYIGLQFYIGTQIHYGWARLDVDSTASQFTIKDYAYNGTPNAFIFAGETGVGITENALSSVTSIFSSNKNVIIRFLNELPINTEVKIINALGQTIYNASVNEKEISIDLSKEKIGIYFVSISKEKIVFTKKVYIR